MYIAINELHPSVAAYIDARHEVTLYTETLRQEQSSAAARMDRLQRKVVVARKALIAADKAGLLFDVSEVARKHMVLPV